jgi:rubrerythrin
MSSERASEESPDVATPSLNEILDMHAKIETQVGEIYVTFAAMFGQNAELRALWSAMALEEGGHAALLRAVNKGILSGVFQTKTFLLPSEISDSLAVQIAEYHRQAQEDVSLDQALRVTWELECSELDFMRELLVSSSNLGELGFPTNLESKDKHIGRLRELIQKYTTDEGLRREVKFLSSERFPR